MSYQGQSECKLAYRQVIIYNKLLLNDNYSDIISYFTVVTVIIYKCPTNIIIIRRWLRIQMTTHNQVKLTNVLLPRDGNGPTAADFPTVSTCLCS